MKIAVAAAGDSLQAAADPRFGRCANFVVVDTETGDATAVANSGAEAGSGAGINAAQIVANTGATVVIGGSFGPNAIEALAAGGIEAFSGAMGTVAEAVEACKAGRLERAG